MKKTSRALGMLGLLSAVTLAACEDRPAPPATTEAFASANAAHLPGYAMAVGQDAAALYVGSSDQILRRVDKATLEVTTLTAPQAPFFDGIAVDTTDIYFTVLIDSDHGEVRRLAKSGGSPTTVATGFRHPWGIATDSDTVYVADMGTFAVGASGDDGVIRSFPKAGGPTTILAQGEQLPTSIAVDETGVVWGNTSWGSVNGSIRRVPKAGGAVTTLAPNVDPGILTIVDGSAFWQGILGIQTVPLGGGDVRTLTTHGAEGIGAFTADATGAYFGDYGPENQGSVLYVPLSGGTPVPIAPASAQAADALTGGTTFTLVDACRLFAVEYDATYAAGASTIVHRMGKESGPVTEHASRACVY